MRVKEKSFENSAASNNSFNRIANSTTLIARLAANHVSSRRLMPGVGLLQVGD